MNETDYDWKKEERILRAGRQLGEVITFICKTSFIPVPFLLDNMRAIIYTYLDDCEQKGIKPSWETWGKEELDEVSTHSPTEGKDGGSC